MREFVTKQDAPKRHKRHTTTLHNHNAQGNHITTNPGEEPTSNRQRLRRRYRR
jgi:hypothetical protein